MLFIATTAIAVNEFKSSNDFFLLEFAGSSGDELDLSKDSNRSTSLVPPALQLTPWSPPSYADRLKVILKMSRPEFKNSLFEK